MYVEPQTEWGSQINQIAQGYLQPPARGIAHGVQKDALQNSWGARSNGKRKGKWGVEFVLTQDGHGTALLTVTDWGTHGLTGQIFRPEDIPDHLPPDERLARFENMNFSGGNYGPGLYGRGKLIFQAASKRREIIYDSLTVDGKYRLGRRFQEGRHLRQFPRVLEGDEARQMLKILTKAALKPLKEVGTRITIVDPVKELVDAAENGDLLNYIEETWWEILLKYDAAIRSSANGAVKHAKCPDFLEKLASGALPDKQVHRVEGRTIEIKGSPYRVKRFVMAKLDKPILEGLRGLYVQRKGMKVGLIDLKDMPPDLEDRFVGFIELDKDYEELIAEAESVEHYGFSGYYASYRELKKFAQLEFDNFKRKLGYAVGAPSADKTAREALRMASLKLNELMDTLGLSGIGRPGTQTKDISVRIESVTFPAATNEVHLGEQISDIKFRVDNNSKYTYKLNVAVETQREAGGLIETLHTSTIELSKHTSKAIGPVTINLQSNYPNYETVVCICRVEGTDGKGKAHASIPIFIGIAKPQTQESVKLRLEAINFPRSDSTRVNFGEEIKDLRYIAQNLTQNDLEVRFLLRALDKEHDKQRITTVVDQALVLKPMVEEPMHIPSILIDSATYGNVGEGEVVLRARVVSAKDQHGHEKSDILAEHNVDFWLNRDPKGQGIFEEFEYFEGGPDNPRADVRQGSTPGRWVFKLNITHPHYEAVKESDEQRRKIVDAPRYAFELMMREALFIALRVERFDALENKVSIGDEPYEVAKAYNTASDKIMANYYQ